MLWVCFVYVKIYLQCLNFLFCGNVCKCKRVVCYVFINVLKFNKNFVIVDDVFSGVIIFYLVLVVSIISNNCFIVILVENIVRLCFYIDCGLDCIFFVGIFFNQIEKD